MKVPLLCFFFFFYKFSVHSNFGSERSRTVQYYVVCRSFLAQSPRGIFRHNVAFLHGMEGVQDNIFKNENAQLAI